MQTNIGGMISKLGVTNNNNNNKKGAKVLNNSM